MYTYIIVLYFAAISLLHTVESSPLLPLRFVHAVLDGPNCDVWINGKIVFQNITASTVTPFYDPGHAAQVGFNISGVFVTMYYAGTRTTYPYSGIFLHDESPKRGYNLTTAIVGAYNSARNYIEPYGGQTYVEHSNSLASFRTQFFSPYRSDKLSIKLSYWSGNTLVTKLKSEVNSQENEPFSTIFPGKYIVNITDVVTGNFTWSTELNFVAGSAYTILAMGTSSSKAASSPLKLSIKVLTDSIQLPTPTSEPQPQPVSPLPVQVPPSVLCPPSSESLTSSYTLYTVAFAFLAGVIITYCALKGIHSTAYLLHPQSILPTTASTKKQSNFDML